MTNGANDWGVKFSQITWLQKMLATHPNVSEVERRDDILFLVTRKQQNDTLRVLCCNEYTAGIAVIQRGLDELGDLNIVYIGGGWNGYTEQAKEYCIQNHIGLYVSDEMSGALWKNDFWTYHKKDKDGDPIYFYRSA
jgi:hypothetical protein